MAARVERLVIRRDVDPVGLEGACANGDGLDCGDPCSDLVVGRARVFRVRLLRRSRPALAHEEGELVGRESRREACRAVRHDIAFGGHDACALALPHDHGDRGRRDGSHSLLITEAIALLLAEIDDRVLFVDADGADLPLGRRSFLSE